MKQLYDELKVGLDDIEDQCWKRLGETRGNQVQRQIDNPLWIQIWTFVSRWVTNQMYDTNDNSSPWT